MKKVYKKLKEQAISIYSLIRSDFKDRVVMAIIFATATTIVGYYAPRIFTMVVGADYYYEITEPIEVIADEYSPCNDLQILYRRDSLISGTIENNWKISLIEQDSINGEIHEHTVIDISANPTITKGFRVVPIENITLPCDAPKGNYYGVYTYTIVVNGISLTKEIPIEPFIVK